MLKLTSKKLRLVLVLLAVLISAAAYAQTLQRLNFVSLSVSKNTGQDYSPWLNDNLDSLVHEAWEGNFVYTDVMLKFKYHSKVSQLKLYDYTGVFDNDPAVLYALNGTEKTLLGTFSGPGYMTFQYINLPQPVDADAIIVHKFSNNIPQKIFAYGTQDTTKLVPEGLKLDEQENNNPQTPPGNTGPVEEPDNLTKIPIEAGRWFQLNNVSDGLQGMFDGVTETEVYTGWGKIFNNYDAYYPVAEGERINIKKIKFFNNTGGLGDYPLTVSVIDSLGNRKVIAVYKGGFYKKWLGPYPDRPNVFLLDTAITNARYIVLNCWYQFPTEIEFYGDHKPAPVPQNQPADVPDVVAKNYPFKNYLGINAFEWDFEDGNNPDNVEATRFNAMRTFTQVRHYMDWEKLESTQGGYTFSPTHSGGWSYDAMYKACKEYGILVLADLKTLPNWLLESYPAGERDHENVPVKYGANFSDPRSYIEQAKVAFQFAARYGSNTAVDKKLLSVNSNPRWTGDPINKVRVGLNYIKYIECDNERDKWWKGRKGYQTAYEYAANLSAFYDGHKNTMGPGIGVKNADPNMLVVMGGLASATTEYVQAMVEWCRINRGYKADGTVNLCWDVINYHWYSHDAQMIPNSIPTRGVAPEKNNTFDKAKAFIDMAKKYAGNMPVWVTEVGYDANPESPMRAIPIGNKNILRTQADWILRSSLLYARAGVERIFFYQAYDDNYANPVQYGSSGLLNQDRSRKPAADFIFQANKLIGKYSYKETLNADPMVDRYEQDGKSAYVLFIPDEVGRTGQYELSLPGVDSVMLYNPKVGSDQMGSGKRKVTNGKLMVPVTETPTFILPFYNEAPAARGALMSLKGGVGMANQPVVTDSVNASGPVINLFPNPTASMVNVAFSNTDNSKVHVTLTDPVVGRTYGKYSFTKPAEQFSETLNISNLPDGVYLVMIQQGASTHVKRVIKTH